MEKQFDANVETLTIIIPKGRKQDVLNILEKIDFIQVDTLENRLERYIKNAPQDIPIDETEIADWITQTRKK